MKIEKNDKLVTMLSASAHGIGDEDANQKVAEFCAELASNPSPENRYHMAELIRFAVDDGLEQRWAFYNDIADTKTVGDNDEALFDVDYDEAFAVLQADNATTPMWMPGSKTVGVNTIEVASRFRVSMYDVRSGKANIPLQTARALRAMDNAIGDKLMEVVNNAYNGTQIAAPFYGTGSGVVTATLDPMIRHFQRYGKTNLLGDIEILDKLATAANTNDWVSDPQRDEMYENGFLAKYKGAGVAQILGGYKKDGVTPVAPTKKLFILPAGIASPLKLVKKGAVLAIDETHADTGFFEVSLRQRFGAALVYGKTPMMGVYTDTSV